MNIRKLLAITGVVSLAALGMGQANGRSFTYTSADAVDTDYSQAGDVAFKVRTKVTVNPYLYISGNLGAEWTVDGWGSGTDSRTESLRFYHNETLTLDLEQFDNPNKVSGTTTGSQAIDLSGRLRFVHDQKETELWDSGMLPISDLNGMFNPSGPHFEVGYTGGLLRLDFSRKISINPEVGPGVYENVGVIKVIRN
jgi:hypothetical protein